MREGLTLHKVGDAVCNCLTGNHSNQGVTNDSLKPPYKDLQKHHEQRDSRQRAADFIEENEDDGVFCTSPRSKGVITIESECLQYCKFIRV